MGTIPEVFRAQEGSRGEDGMNEMARLHKTGE
jgi:hypothetical protein